MRLAPVLLVGGLWVLSACAAAPAGLDGSPRRTSPSREVLPNGLRVIVQEHRASDVAALHLWVGVGGRDEGPAERGFSHLVEHMLFKGTEGLGPGFVSREIEAVGGRTNAGTSWDYTFYYLLLPAARAARGIEVLAEMALASTFDPDEIAREREVVFEEMRLGEDNPRSYLVRRLYELAFRGHPYGHPVLGDPGALRAAGREALLGYYRRHYVPSNMALVVVGAVEPEVVRAAARRAFGGVPGGAHVRPAPPPQPRLDGSQHLTILRAERQASLGLAWAAPPLGHPDMFAVDLAAHILGGSRSSRLHQALRERARLVSTIRAGYAGLQGGGLLTVTAQLEARDLVAAEAAILAEVRRLAEEGVSAPEHLRALTAAEAHHVFATETAEGRAYAYGHAETIWSLQAQLTYLDRLREVTRDDIRGAARRYLLAQPARLALVPGQAP